MLAALNHPARQVLPGDVVAGQYAFKTVQWQAIDLVGRQQHGQHAGADHALFDQLGWLVSSDRRSFAAPAPVDLAHVFEYADLHRHNVELLTGFLANNMLAAITGAGQFVLGQILDDFDTRQIGRQWDAPAALAVPVGQGFRRLSGVTRGAF